MSWGSRILRALVSAALIAAVVPHTTAAAAAPSSAAPGYYVIPDGLIVKLDSSGEEFSYVSYGEWQEAGFPAPIKTDGLFTKFSWSPQIWIASSFGRGYTSKHALWHRVSAAEWAAMGYREGVFEYADDPTRPTLLSADGYLTYFTYDDTEKFISAVGYFVHKLTAQELSVSSTLNSQHPSYSAIGLVTLAWHPGAIVVVSEFDQGGSVFTYDEWAALDYPTPQPVPSIYGDYLCEVPGSDDLRYVGLTFNGILTPEQWAATQYMLPVTC